MTRPPVLAKVAEKPTPDPIQVGSFFLETLTTGMYEDPFHSIREYVQNGLDAIQDAIRAQLISEEDGRILISIGGTARAPSISIRDNGIGIPQERAYSTLVSLGASRKTPAHHAGFRGIGRLGGIAYCTTLRFTTKAQGEPVATVVEWDCGRVRSYFAPGAEPVDVREVVRKSVKTRTEQHPEAAHFTEVEMMRLVNLGEEFVEPAKLQPYLRQVCPVEYADNFDYADQVRQLAVAYGEKLPVVQLEMRQKRERVPIHKPYKNSYPTGRRNVYSKLHSIETFMRKDHGWYGWIGVSEFPGEIVDDTAAGVRFRVKNIQIGHSGLIEELAAELTTAGSERRLQRWAVGEIFITGNEVVPNARRDGFEDSAAWRTIQRDIRDQVVKRVIKLIRSASSTRSAMKALNTALAAIEKALGRPSLTSAEQATLQNDIRKHLATLNAADTKLPGADPKEITVLISKFKELNERLTRALIVDPAAPPSEDEEEDGTYTDDGDDEEDAADEPKTTDDEASGVGGGSSDGGTAGAPVAKTQLEIIAEVLVEELGETEAARLMGLIKTRLAGG